MTTDGLSAELIERYVATCGLRSLRGEHDGEFFCVVNTQSARLHVHFELSSSFGDVLNIRINSSATFPAADRPWLTRLADAWNRENRELTAILTAPSGTQRVGISARTSQWIREGVSFEDFAAQLDQTITAAIDLFAELTQVVQLAPITQPLLRRAS